MVGRAQGPGRLERSRMVEGWRQDPRGGGDPPRVACSG